MKERIALYAGSFDPYTLGHHDIVKKACRLFDRVDVLIGVNTRKQRAFDAHTMADAIRAALSEDGIKNARVVIHDGLVADYCAREGIEWYVRGLRGPADYAYEENGAAVNRMLNPALETIYLRADRPAVSSSMIRELLRFGRSVNEFLPDAVAKAIALNP